MLGATAVLFGGLTVGAILQVREATELGARRAAWRWRALALLLGPITRLITVGLLLEPKLLLWTPATGFGIEWWCSDNVPRSARLCFRR